MLDLRHFLAAILLFAASCVLYTYAFQDVRTDRPEVSATAESVRASMAVPPDAVDVTADGSPLLTPGHLDKSEINSVPFAQDFPVSAEMQNVPSVKHEKTVEKNAVSVKKADADHGKRESAAPAPCAKVKVGLVIDDFGHSYKIAKQILDMKLTATWAVIPGTADAMKVAQLAEKSGQPFLVHLPMQAVSDNDGSSEYLIGVDTPPEKIHGYVEKFRAAFPAAIGVNNHRGSKATSDRATMEEFMSAMAETDWGFLDSRTIGKTVAKKVAQEYHIPTAENRIFIDGTTDLSTMKKRFEHALKMARRDGTVIAICHARAKTLPFLRYVSKTEFRHVEFVTVDKLWN